MNYKIRLTLLAFTIYFLIGSCKIPINTPLLGQSELSNGNTFDFTAIGEAVKDKKIVALGESSHGVGDFYAFKAELVKYLHKHHGFEVLAFEAGLGDLNLGYSGLDSLTADQLLYHTLFGNFQCEEIEPLFDYIKSVHKSDRPLNYTGFDNQPSSSFFQNTIQPVISQYVPELKDGLEEGLNGYVRWFRAGYYKDSLKYISEANDFRDLAQQIQNTFNDNKPEIKSQFNLKDDDFKYINQTCEGFIRTVDLPYSEKHLGSGNRDAIMFDNFQWLLKEIYPDKKVIIWAHNAHIEQQAMFENSFKWMGHFLNEFYGDDYYTLGIFAQSGEAYQQWGDTTITLNNTDTTMIESVMMKTGHQTSFLDVSRVDTGDANYAWITESIMGFENENGGIVSFVPKERFDGVVVMRSVKAPNY